jgi:hypothetical protein
MTSALPPELALFKIKLDFSKLRFPHSQNTVKISLILPVIHHERYLVSDGFFAKVHLWKRPYFSAGTSGTGDGFLSTNCR